MIIFVSLLVAIIGLLMYVMSTNPKVAECGRIMFFAGLLVTLDKMPPASISLLGR